MKKMSNPRDPPLIRKEQQVDGVLKQCDQHCADRSQQPGRQGQEAAAADRRAGSQVCKLPNLKKVGPASQGEIKKI